MQFSIKDDYESLPDMAPMLTKQTCSNFMILTLLTLSIVFTFINRDKPSEEWPLPDNVVIHNVVPFTHDNKLWKMFAKNEHDFNKLVFDKLVTDTYTTDADKLAGGVKPRGLSGIEALQVVSGCYPENILKYGQLQILQGKDNTGMVSVPSGVNEGKHYAADAQTIQLLAPITNLQNGDFLVIYTSTVTDEKINYNTEFVKVTAQSGKEVTVDRGATDAKLTASDMSGTAAIIPTGTYVYRVADGTVPVQPYKFDIADSMTLTAAATANGNFPEYSLCSCLNDVRAIVDAWDVTANYEDVWNAIGGLNATDADGKLQSFPHVGHATYNRKGAMGSEALTLAAKQFYTDLGVVWDDKTNKHYGNGKDGVVDSKEFKINAVDSCIANYIPEYTLKYEGVIDTRHIDSTGQIFLYIGIITVIVSLMYTNKNKSIKAADNLTNSVDNLINHVWSSQFGNALICAGSVLALAMTLAYDPHLHNCGESALGEGDRFKCYSERKLLNNRDGTYDRPYLVVNSAFHVTVSIGFGLTAAIALARTINSFFYEGKRDVVENSVIRRVAIDLAFILGYACMGTALLAQAGVQDATSLLFSFLMLIVTGFLQHISNIAKIIYDSLCRNTDPDTMKNIFQNGKTDSYVKQTLQFFGWSRLFIFITVLATSFTYLSMTREAIEGNNVQSFMNGQLVYFILAFFWSNVGYDILRELIPFTLETVNMDVSKITITLIYLTYYNLNNYFFWRQISNSGDIDEYALHAAHSL